MKTSAKAALIVIAALCMISVILSVGLSAIYTSKLQDTKVFLTHRNAGLNGEITRLKAELAFLSKRLEGVQNDTEPPTDTTQETTKGPFTPETLPLLDSAYIMRSFNDKIGIFAIEDGGKESLVRVLNIYVDSLPESDRKALDRGICTECFEDMQKIIDRFE